MFTVVKDKFNKTRSSAFGPYSGGHPVPRETAASLHKPGLSAAQDEADARVWTNVFFSFGRNGWRWRWFTGYDCRGWLPQIPPAQWCEAEVEQRHVEDGISWGSEGGRKEEEAFFQRQMWPPSPPFCLNKSCSRSFYLHMLTGTSEIPGGETSREEDRGGRRKKRKRSS